MKKHILLALMLLGSFISCQEEEMLQLDTPAATLAATIENLENTSIHWTYGSELIHWIGSNVTRYFLEESSAGKTSGSFVNMGSVEDVLVSSTPLQDAVAVFPFDKDIKCVTGKDNKYKLTDVTLADNISYGNIVFPMAAVAAPQDSLNFMHICGAIELSVTGNDKTVKSIEITGNGDEPLSGSCEISVSKDGAPEASMIEKGATGITLNCGGKGIQLDSKKASRLLIPIPPGKYSQGLTLSFKIKDREENLEIVIDKSVTIRRAEVYKYSIKLVEDSGEVDDNEESENDSENEDNTEEDEKEDIFVPETDTGELLNLVAVDYDGYTMRLNMPANITGEYGPGTSAIRYNQRCIMLYNYMLKQGYDDYWTLLFNGHKYSVQSENVKYSEETNWYQTDYDHDGDGKFDWDTHYNPISPGEPVVFVAGEFEWMEDTPEYENEYFMYPSGWPSGYYSPCINTDYYNKGKKSINTIAWDYTHPMDEYWTGAFQRKLFRTKEPKPLDAGVEIRLADVSPVNATIEFYPDEDVYSYVVCIFDEESYLNILLPLINNNPDYLQWAITSYFAVYTLGTANLSGPVYYYIDSIKADSKYYVFVTALGNPEGTSQSFQTFEFTTGTKVLPAPVIEVTPLEDKTTPYLATFNVKCTTYKENPIMKAYYAANYVRDWKLATNSGSTYFSLLNGNNPFSAQEIAAINSEEGYTISFPSVDGETTRLAVLGYNTEYTPNDVTSFKTAEILDCPAVADVTTPWAPEKDVVDPIHYEDLIGTWTATAVLRDGTDAAAIYKFSSKITIGDEVPEYPETLPNEVYKIFKDMYDMEADEVDALWTEFKQHAELFNVNRLMNQNRLLCTGWLNDDSYGRLTARTPYDLFVAKDYWLVDISSIYNDFGPKWYIEAVKDEKTGEISLVVPADANFLPPTSNWHVPFYMAAMHPETYIAFTYPPEGASLSFPVKYDAEKDQITIKPFIFNGEEYYPNMIGFESATGKTIIENPVVSEVVLTRGWEESSSTRRLSSRSTSRNVRVDGNLPTVVYKERTRLKAKPALQQVEYRIVSEDEFRERADGYVSRMLDR